MSGQALAIHDVTFVIHPHRVKHTFGDIDPEDVHLLLHWTRLLWLNGFTALELIVAHCRRSAQGRVHFITTALSGIGRMLRRRVVCRDVTCGILLTHRHGSASELIPTASMREREAVLCG